MLYLKNSELEKGNGIEMRNLIGKQWKSLTEDEKTVLLNNPNAIDAETGNTCKEGDCIIDLTLELSISGKVVDGNIVINDEAVIYNPEIGIQ